MGRRPETKPTEDVSSSETGGDATATKEAEGHRVRVGRERRERMRAHLLASVLHVCSTETVRAPVYIDDVIQHAGVSRGTFYKYFTSLDEAIAEVAGEIGNQMTVSVLPVYDHLEDPVDRVATGFQLFLIRALLDPQWGAFILRMDLLREGDLLPAKIYDDVALGVERGAFTVPSVRIACDALMGMKYEAIRRIIHAKPDQEYIQLMASMVLKSFGVPTSQANAAPRAAIAKLKTDAPDAVFWWKDLPGFLSARAGTSR